MQRLFFALFILLFMVGMVFFQGWALSIIDIVQRASVFAPLLFIGLYILATILFLPTLILTFTGGVLFGPYLGTVVNLTGATCGAVLSFCISRFWAARYFSNTNQQVVEKVQQGIERHGWSFLALVRTLPIIPFNLVNYGMGLTRMSLRKYSLVTFVFLVPTELVYTWFGFTGQKIITTTDIWSNRISVLLALLLVGSFVLLKRRLFCKRKV